MTRPRHGRVLDFALDLKPLRAPDIARDEVVYLVLRRRGRPVGRLVVDGSRVGSGSELMAAAHAAAVPGTIALDAEAGAPRRAPVPAPSRVSVVVATRNRPEDLRACLGALGALDPRPGEIVVVDSASDDPTAVAMIARAGGARLIRCDRPGLSRARNAGAVAAAGEILAFLDDDCRVETGWLAAVLRGFEDERVHAVTGSFVPAELSTRAQILFLEYSHMDRRGMIPHRYGRGHRESRHWPLDAWRAGSGGNLAVRASALRARGGFRPDLGLGTPTRGGEDLFFLWSTIHAGGDVVYRADAMVSHRHHRDIRDLHRVMFGYGAGHEAYLQAAVRAGAGRAGAAVYRASVLFDRVKRLARAVIGLRHEHAGLVVRELAGMLAGPRLARRSRQEPA
jgi:glycosyltransferase involved in cell wall biosynthesis